MKKSKERKKNERERKMEKGRNRRKGLVKKGGRELIWKKVRVVARTREILYQVVHHLPGLVGCHHGFARPPIRTAVILMIVGSHVVFVVRESPRTTVENLFIGSTVTSVELGSTLLAQDQQKNMFVHAVIDFFSFFQL